MSLEFGEVLDVHGPFAMNTQMSKAKEYQVFSEDLENVYASVSIPTGLPVPITSIFSK